MADPYPIRPITDDEFTAYHAVDEHAFHSGPPREAQLQRMIQIFEADRSLAAFDHAQTAGGAASCAR